MTEVPFGFPRSTGRDAAANPTRGAVEQAEERIAAAQRLRQPLLAVMAALAALAAPASVDGEIIVGQLTQLIERMISMDGKLTREQLSEMIEQRQRMTAEPTPEQPAEL